tara:strand:- start:39070 stop:40089 length:1020 start_codon:yes stop_codon:yes gene_type:complete
MRFLQNCFLFALFFITVPSIAQTSVEDVVREGMQYHDNGEFDKAIETYNKAFKIEPKSMLVNYEIALSYFTKGDYEAAIEYSDVILKNDDDFLLQAYVTKGSALDMLGKTKESIKLFEKGIKKLDPHYLIFYNLALNYYKIKDFDNAEKNLVKSIETNPNHPSSHLMLANIHDQKGNEVQTLLAAHYFLFLEPDTDRSKSAYAMIQENFGGNVSKDSEKPNSINITLTPNDDDQMGAAEMMVAMLEASKSTEENKGKTDDELFIENTESFFTVMGELKKKRNKEIWWTFYTPFFYDLAKSNHMTTYCKYISQIGNENSVAWLNENGEKLDDFDAWLKNN